MRWTMVLTIRPAASRCVCGQSSGPPPETGKTMQISEISQDKPEAIDPDLARELQRQVAEWKAMRAPLRSRTAAGGQVERRFKRRPVIPSLQVRRTNGHPPSVDRAVPRWPKAICLDGENRAKATGQDMLTPIAGRKPARTPAPVGTGATERRYSRDGRDRAGVAPIRGGYVSVIETRSNY